MSNYWYKSTEYASGTGYRVYKKQPTAGMLYLTLVGITLPKERTQKMVCGAFSVHAVLSQWVDCVRVYE